MTKIILGDDFPDSLLYIRAHTFDAKKVFN